MFDKVERIPMKSSPFPSSIKGARAMIFVDGENLAIRYGAMLGKGQPHPHVIFDRDIFVWSSLLNMSHHMTCEVIRRYYYTAVHGDAVRREEIHEQLQKHGIEAPRVFPKTKSRGSKRVDISLSVDMLNHAYRNNYDVAVLVAGDEDYVPLVEAVCAAGRRVFLWFVSGGLSPILKRSVDHFFDLDDVLLDQHAPRYLA